MYYFTSDNFIYSLSGKIKINIGYVSGKLQGITIDTKNLNAVNIIDVF